MNQDDYETYQNTGVFADCKEIDLLVEQLVDDELLEFAKTWYREAPEGVRFLAERFGGEGAVRVDSITYKYASNIETKGDIMRFDVTANCHLISNAPDGAGKPHVAAVQCVTFRCLITFDGKEGVFQGLLAYPGDAVRDSSITRPADKNLVPMIRKADLDAEAADFLREFYPEALASPCRVPIREILEKQMGLIVLRNARPTDEAVYVGGQTFGQIFFSNTQIEFVCPQSGEIMQGTAPRGTILLDGSISSGENDGCLNNTLAHEGFHWFRHRVCATIKNALHGNTFIACRKSSPLIRVSKSPWTDEDRLEWQAGSISPRILMPLESFKTKARELMSLYGFSKGEAGNDGALESVIRDLAAFFAVSRQSAGIRLIEVGLIDKASAKGARKAHNFNTTTRISESEAFREYCENPDFRSFVDSGAFRYVEMKFVINDERYITTTKGKSHLTFYAREHADECCLSVSSSFSSDFTAPPEPRKASW